MNYLIASVSCSDDFDDTTYAILEVTQELIDHLSVYMQIAKNASKIDYAVFRENCFDFTGSDLEEEFPELDLKVKKPAQGDVLHTSLDLSGEALIDRLVLPRVECHAVKVYPHCEVFTFIAYGKYNSTEYWFEVSITQIKDALKTEYFSLK
jgi:hypothetical protein